MFLPAIEHQNQNTSEWFILIISDEKKEKNNLIIVILLLEIQNSGQNQIQAMIIYGEEMLNLKLDSLIWTKSDYLTAFKIYSFILCSSIQIVSEEKRVFVPCV